jgi:glycogen synthase
VFADTFFFHLVHNLDVDYEGRLYFDPCVQGFIDHMVQLPPDLFKDPFWHPANNQIIYNPSRVALLSSDSWGTVSPSYRDELLQSSPLAPLMGKSAHPFAYVNGIPTAARTQRLEALSLPDTTDAHLTRKQRAKSALQDKYFGRVDPSIPLFAYVGRITEQKGVHHILSVAEQKIKELDDNIMFLVGGPGNPGEQYSIKCMRKMDDLRHRFPSSFWADPQLFFIDGPLVNLGADAGLMPSKFEPSGIVQQEFFVAGTPVVAFKTGGLKDTVFDFSPETGLGKGFTFEAHTHDDFYSALNRAVDTFNAPALAAQLCKNARDSVLDLATVSFSWYKEFMRCRKCLVDVAPLLVRFPAPVVEGVAAMPNVVKVRGDCTDGREVELVLDSASGEMTHQFKLADGTYMYEFVVDGLAALAPGVPTLTMKDGSKSHVAVIKQMGGI